MYVLELLKAIYRNLFPVMDWNNDCNVKLGLFNKEDTFSENI